MFHIEEQNIVGFVCPEVVQNHVDAVDVGGYPRLNPLQEVDEGRDPAFLVGGGEGLTSVGAESAEDVSSRFAVAIVLQLLSGPSSRLIFVRARGPHNPCMRLREKGKARISLSPLPAQAEPPNLDDLGIEIAGRWPMTSLLDILKEADLRLGLTSHFTTVASRQILDPDTLRKRLLLCLYGLGTNTGLKRISAGDQDSGYQDLRYVRRRFVHKEQLRAAIACVVNGIFSTRSTEIWGEATTRTCSRSLPAQ